MAEGTAARDAHRAPPCASGTRPGPRARRRRRGRPRRPGGPAGAGRLRRASRTRSRRPRDAQLEARRVHGLDDAAVAVARPGPHAHRVADRLARARAPRRPQQPRDRRVSALLRHVERRAPGARAQVGGRPGVEQRARRSRGRRSPPPGAGPSSRSGPPRRARRRRAAGPARPRAAPRRRRAAAPGGRTASRALGSPPARSQRREPAPPRRGSRPAPGRVRPALSAAHPAPATTASRPTATDVALTGSTRSPAHRACDAAAPRASPRRRGARDG